MVLFAFFPTFVQRASVRGAFLKTSYTRHLRRRSLVVVDAVEAQGLDSDSDTDPLCLTLFVVATSRDNDVLQAN